MSLRIPCAMCKYDTFNKHRCVCTKCPDFHLCLSCFFQATPVPPHKEDHPVFVYPGGLCQKSKNSSAKPDSPSSSLWTLDEDRFLLEGVKKQGFGNWNEISDLIGTKSELACQERFFSEYNIKVSKNVKTIADFKKENNEFISHLPPKLYERRNEFGFLPFRLEFSTEPYNDTEFLITDMGVTDHLNDILLPNFPEIKTPTFKPSETLEKKQYEYKKLNSEIIKIYNDMICERHSQKNFVLNSELLWRTNTRKKNKDDEIFNLLKPFRRLVNTDEEFEDIVKGLSKQREIEEKLASEIFQGIDMVSCLDSKNKSQCLKDISKATGINVNDLEIIEKNIASIVKNSKRVKNMNVELEGRRYCEISQGEDENSYRVVMDNK